jgi:nucleoside-diphosphate-sugar epimerase
MRVFIIGGRGFIGSAFVRWCQEHDVEHAIVGRDDLHEYAGQRCDVLINAAGNSSKVLAERDPIADHRQNVEQVRELLRQFRFDVWVQLSSCDVYENLSDPAANHEDVNICYRPRSAYGFHKFLAEQYVAQCASEWLILRLGGCVGPDLRKNAVFDVLRGGPVWIHPDSRLQYMHTDDVARCTFELLGRGSRQTVFNLCGTGTVSIRQCIESSARTVTFADRASALPRVVYDVNTERVRRICTIPHSREVVRQFIAAQTAEVGRREP